MLFMQQQRVDLHCKPVIVGVVGLENIWHGTMSLPPLPLQLIRTLARRRLHIVVLWSSLWSTALSETENWKSLMKTQDKKYKSRAFRGGKKVVKTTGAYNMCYFEILPIPRGDLPFTCVVQVQLYLYCLLCAAAPFFFLFFFLNRCRGWICNSALTCMESSKQDSPQLCRVHVDT